MTAEQIVDVYLEIMQEKVRERMLSPDLGLAVIQQESSGAPFTFSPANAYGLMQLRRACIIDYNRAHGTKWTVFDVIFNPAVCIEIGTWYLHWLLGQLELRDALRAYNAGIGRVKSGDKEAGGSYADQVLRKMAIMAAILERPEVKEGFC